MYSQGGLLDYFDCLRSKILPEAKINPVHFYPPLGKILPELRGKND